jgi:hypothetical protein
MEVVFCCNNLLATPFCPQCGTSKEKAMEKKIQNYPLKFITYLHGEGKEDEERRTFVLRLGLTPGSDESERIYRCDGEIGIVWQKDGLYTNPIPVALTNFKKVYALVEQSDTYQGSLLEGVYLR